MAEALRRRDKTVRLENVAALEPVRTSMSGPGPIAVQSAPLPLSSLQRSKRWAFHPCERQQQEAQRSGIASETLGAMRSAILAAALAAAAALQPTPPRRRPRTILHTSKKHAGTRQRRKAPAVSGKVENAAIPEGYLRRAGDHEGGPVRG